MNVKNNRRAQMTREMLKSALLKLLENQNISEISIKTLCEEADINRSTFYSHYQNQMELLIDIESETFNQMKQYMFSNYSGVFKSSYEIFLWILTFVYENKSLFSILFGPNVNNDARVSLYHLSDESDYMNQLLNTYFEPDELSYVRLFRIHGLVAVIKEWLSNDCKAPADQIARLLVRLTEGYPHEPTS